VRKADYQALASILRDARRGCDSAQLSMIERIARMFVQRANIDPKTFLKACGID
jgi:hypothetical protein